MDQSSQSKLSDIPSSPTSEPKLSSCVNLFLMHKFETEMVNGKLELDESDYNLFKKLVETDERKRAQEKENHRHINLASNPTLDELMSMQRELLLFRKTLETKLSALDSQVSLLISGSPAAGSDTKALNNGDISIYPHPAKGLPSPAVTSKQIISPPHSRPSSQMMNTIKSGRLVIHAEKNAFPLKDETSTGLTSLTNASLAAIGVKTNNHNIKVEAVHTLSPDDSAFSTRSGVQAQWLLENKHHSSHFETDSPRFTPNSHSILIHGLPLSEFDPKNRDHLTILAKENDFEVEFLYKARWLTGKPPSNKLASSVVVTFTDKELSDRLLCAGVFYKCSYFRTAKYR